MKTFLVGTSSVDLLCLMAIPCLSGHHLIDTEGRNVGQVHFFKVSGTILPLTTSIGDNDGYGYGIADNADTPEVLFDNRSPEELLATDGSQFTDHAASPSLSAIDFVLPLRGILISATVTLDVQGLQTTPYIPSFFNGILQTDLLTYSVLNSRGTQVKRVTLTPEVVAAVNAEGALIYFTRQ